MQTMFAFVIDEPGGALDGSELHIAASGEVEAQKLADARSKLFKAPLRRATDRDVRVVVKVAS